MSNAVIILAGGAGKRMGKTSVPKQFIPLAGFPILMHTIKQFKNVFADIRIILVLPADQMIQWNDLCREYQFNISHEIISGGPQRFHSVKRGLTLIRDEALIGIHDGVRPLVNEESIIKSFTEAERFGNAIPCLPIKESVRIMTGNTSKSFDRTRFKTIQTPQVFSRNIILNAYRQQYKEEFTDDATVVEATGESIHLFEGNVENIKITTPQDLVIAEALILNSK